MSFSLRFVKGPSSGSSFGLASASAVLGRSRSCDIRLASPDVSGRHLAFSIDDTGVAALNLSAHKTKVNGTDIAQDQNVRLKVGDEVQVGESNVFVLCEDSVAEARESAADKTVLPAPEGAVTRLPEPNAAPTPAAAQVPDSVQAFGSASESAMGAEHEVGMDETQVLRTQLAGSSEIEKLKELQARRRTLKVALKVLAAVFIFVGVAAIYYFFVRQVPETVLSWPTTADGAYDRRRTLLDTPLGAGMVGIDTPGGPSFRVQKLTNGTTVVETRIGKYRDVPCRYAFFCRQDATFLRQDRMALFARERKRFEELGGWNFLAVSPVTFFGPDNGIPAVEVQYLRLERTEHDSTQWFGYLTFVCHGDCIMVQTREIPAIEQWRGASFLARNRPLMFGSAPVIEHWEGCANARQGRAEDLIAEADGLLSKDSPLLWTEVEFLLRSALVGTCGRGANGKKALRALRELRARQGREYARLQVEWEKARRLGAENDCKKILSDALKVFASADDHRNELLRRGVWK